MVYEAVLNRVTQAMEETSTYYGVFRKDMVDVGNLSLDLGLHDYDSRTKFGQGNSPTCNGHRWRQSQNNDGAIFDRAWGRAREISRSRRSLSVAMLTGGHVLCFGAAKHPRVPPNYLPEGWLQSGDEGLKSRG